MTFKVTFGLLWGRPRKTLFSHFRLTFNLSGVSGGFRRSAFSQQESQTFLKQRKDFLENSAFSSRLAHPLRLFASCVVQESRSETSPEWYGQRRCRTEIARLLLVCVCVFSTSRIFQRDGLNLPDCLKACRVLLPSEKRPLMKVHPKRLTHFNAKSHDSGGSGSALSSWNKGSYGSSFPVRAWFLVVLPAVF